MNALTNPSIVAKAAEIQKINAIINAYHTADPEDKFIDDQVDLICEKMLAIAASPITNASDAVAALGQLVNYLEPGDDCAEDKIIGGIIHAVRAFLSTQQ
jgi:hypothetical protein